MPPRLVPVVSSLVWLWLGAALLFTTVVAPAAFAVLPSRTLAGALAGRVLPALFWSGALVGIVVLATSQGWRRAAGALLVVAALAAQLGVAPRIASVRRTLGPDLEAVPAADARRVAFGRLHALSVALLGIGMLAAGAIGVGDWRSSRVAVRSRALSSTGSPTAPSPDRLPTPIG